MKKELLNALHTSLWGVLTRVAQVDVSCAVDFVIKASCDLPDFTAIALGPNVSVDSLQARDVSTLPTFRFQNYYGDLLQVTMEPQTCPPAEQEVPDVFVTDKLNGCQIYEATVEQLQQYITKGNFSSEEYVRFCLERIRGVGMT